MASRYFAARYFSARYFSSGFLGGVADAAAAALDWLLNARRRHGR